MKPEQNDVKQSAYCVEFLYAKMNCSEELKQCLLEIAEKSKQEVGCIQYNVLNDKQDPNLFILVLNYVDEKAMAEHEKKEYVTNFAEEKMHLLCEEVYWHNAKPVMPV